MPAKKKSSASKVTKTNPKQSKKTTEESYDSSSITAVSYTHLRAHETGA